MADCGKLLCRLGRDTDCARRADRIEQRSADPPDGVGGKLQTAAVVEPLDGLHQADRPLLDQIGERNPAPPVGLRDREHETKVAFDHLLLRSSAIATK